MKSCVCFVFLLSCASSHASENYWLGQVDGYNVYPDYNRPTIEREYINRDPPHHKNADDHVERPCSIHDIDCIRHILSIKAICLPSSGPSLDPFIIKKLTLDVPHSNTSFTIINAAVKGLQSGKIEEFYINKKTDTLILEVVFDAIIIDSPTNIATYYRKGKEPIEASDSSTAIFKKVSLTLIVTHINNIHLAESHVYAYLSDPNILITLGPGLEDIKGLPLSSLSLKWRDEIALTVQEAMVKQAPIYLNAFLQNKICNVKHY